MAVTEMGSPHAAYCLPELQASAAIRAPRSLLLEDISASPPCAAPARQSQQGGPDSCRFFQLRFQGATGDVRYFP